MAPWQADARPHQAQPPSWVPQVQGPHRSGPIFAGRDGLQGEQCVRIGRLAVGQLGPWPRLSPCVTFRVFSGALRLLLGSHLVVCSL